MHEMTRATRLLEELQRKGYEKKSTFVLGHLETTQITLEEVQECFDIVAKGTGLEGSKLRFVPVETRVKCRTCDHVFGVSKDNIVLSCPNCGGKDLEILDEDELVLLGVED